MMKSLEANKIGNEGTAFEFTNASLFRKRVIGDRRNYTSLEMAWKLDDVIAKITICL